MPEASAGTKRSSAVRQVAAKTRTAGTVLGIGAVVIAKTPSSPDGAPGTVTAINAETNSSQVKMDLTGSLVCISTHLMHIRSPTCPHLLPTSRTYAPTPCPHHAPPPPTSLPPTPHPRVWQLWVESKYLSAANTVLTGLATGLRAALELDTFVRERGTLVDEDTLLNQPSGVPFGCIASGDEGYQQHGNMGEIVPSEINIIFSEWGTKDQSANLSIGDLLTFGGVTPPSCPCPYLRPPRRRPRHRPHHRRPHHRPRRRPRRRCRPHRRPCPLHPYPIP
jgi:hypothetical protein